MCGNLHKGKVRDEDCNDNSDTITHVWRPRFHRHAFHATTVQWLLPKQIYAPYGAAVAAYHRATGAWWAAPALASAMRQVETWRRCMPAGQVMYLMYGAATLRRNAQLQCTVSAPYVVYVPFGWHICMDASAAHALFYAPIQQTTPILVKCATQHR
jgi:hypothetical protein